MPGLAQCEEAKKVAKKGSPLNFFEDFMLAGTAAVMSKTIAAPIERIKMVRCTLLPVSLSLCPGLSSC
jgi:hypothetical protein